MQRHSKLISLAAVLSLAAAGAFAQTPAPTTMPTSTPDAVGVSPQTAVEATQKAVPRSDTGTLVRTSPSATDQAKSAMDNTTSGMDTTTTGTSTATNRPSTPPSPPGTMPMNRPAKTTPMRRARADRN